DSQKYIIESKEFPSAATNNYLQDVSLMTTNEIPHINNLDIEDEMVQYIRKAGYR
ncbi:31636_t:CDS:2, partial [Racocetra persica]